MANIKVSELPDLTLIEDSDFLIVNDISSATTKKITRGNLLDGIARNLRDSGNDVIVSSDLTVNNDVIIGGDLTMTGTVTTGDIDVNSNRILNLIDATTSAEPVTLGQLEEVVPPRTHKFTRRITPADSDTTATISFPTNASWVPNIVKATVCSTLPTSGNAGIASSLYGLRSVSSSTAVITGQTNILTDSDCVLSTSLGTETITLTATFSTTGVNAIWDIEVTTYTNGDVDVSYS